MCGTQVPSGWAVDVEDGVAVLSFCGCERTRLPLEDAVRLAKTLLAHRKRTHVDEDAVLAMEGG